jgi:nucleoid DNA-binding protein
MDARKVKRRKVDPSAKERMKKAQLDIRVAIKTTLPLGEVECITDAFLQEIMEQLVTGKELELGGLGILHVRRTLQREGFTSTLKRPGKRKPIVVAIPVKYYVLLRKGNALRTMLKMASKTWEEDRGKVRSR